MYIWDEDVQWDRAYRMTVSNASTLYDKMKQDFRRSFACSLFITSVGSFDLRPDNGKSLCEAWSSNRSVQPRTRTPIIHSCIMYSMLTHECVNTASSASFRFAKTTYSSLKSFVPSLPATRIISFSPPGWKGRYGVILYTLPLNTDQASSLLLCWSQPQS
jgi:hypothetical protein